MADGPDSEAVGFGFSGSGQTGLVAGRLYDGVNASVPNKGPLLATSWWHVNTGAGRLASLYPLQVGDG